MTSSATPSVATTVAHSTFSINQWDEKSHYEFADSAKLNRAAVAYAYTGDIKGESTLEYLLYYCTDGSGTHTGFERITGSLGERTGSFVLHHTGTFDKESVYDTYTVVPNSGTDELQGLRGEGRMKLVHAESYALALEYFFE
jgi:hypothetical protein